MSNILLFETLSRVALRMKALRQVPEGLCKRCEGTGAGEALADLVESLSRGRQLPIRDCKSCSGTGMAIAKVEVAPLGLLLLFPIAAAIYQNRRESTTGSIVPDLAEPPTRELLSLIGAVGASAPTVDANNTESIRPKEVAEKRTS
jgi:hypothetical protein